MHKRDDEELIEERPEPHDLTKCCAVLVTTGRR